MTIDLNNLALLLTAAIQLVIMLKIVILFKETSVSLITRKTQKWKLQMQLEEIDKLKQDIAGLKMAFDDLSQDQYKLIQRTTELNELCVRLLQSKEPEK